MSERISNDALLINSKKPVAFEFDGKSYQGFEGDSLASALLANDVTLLGRSFKYHRPRGLLASGADEPNALVGTGEGVAFEPNNRVTMVPISKGLKAISQNRMPSLGFDFSSVNNFLWRVFPAGFYYKTFMWPRAFWKGLYEPVIRRQAGLGKATNPGDPSRYEHYYAHFDVVIAGGGVAGLLAAEALGSAGLKVLLAEQNRYWGGRALVDGEAFDGQAASDWIDAQIKKLEGMDNVTLRLNLQISGSYDHGYILANEACEKGPRNRLWRIRASRLIAATGAIERPLAFANNDRPGVMLASSVRDYLALYGVGLGKKGVIVTNNDDAYRTGLALHEAGVEIAAIVDLRKEASSELISRVEATGIRVERGQCILQVKGGKTIKGVEICDVDGAGKDKEELDCDFVAMSGGWSPVVHLFSHCGGKLNWMDEEAHFAPDAERPPRTFDGSPMVFAAGSASGAMQNQACLNSALEASKAVAKLQKAKLGSVKAPKVAGEKPAPIEAVWMSPKGAPYKKRAKAFLDFQHDVKVSDIQLAAQEGFQSVEHAKRYTTLGMATDQGKTSNINGLAILSEALASPIPEVGTTTFRPPYTPIPMGAIAGAHTGGLFKPLRKTVVHDWHEKQNLKWEPVGDWRRPYTYMLEGEDAQMAVTREVKNTRENVGLLDASTLGKILVQGPDAGKFLDLLYTNMMSTLKVGYCRYGLMTNENGFVHDDGVVARIDEESFICHTTSGGSDRVYAMMEEWLQTEWWNLKVYASNLTEHYAQFAVVGPKARRVLEALGGMDVSAKKLPFMQFRDGELAGFPVRVYRISFSGELSYEIAIRADQGRKFWDKLLKTGKKFGMMPYGTEALHVMRAEKGFIMVGDETDGTVTPYDLNMNWIVSKKKSDFIGMRGLARPLFHEENRRQLVGLETEAAQTVLPHAACAIEGQHADGLEKIIGYVTSSYYSPTLDRSIAMGLIEGGKGRMGESLSFKCLDGREIKATIVDPVFYDKEGEKQNVA